MALGSSAFCGLKAIFQYQPSDASHWAAAALAGAPAGILFGLIVTTIAQFRAEARRRSIEAEEKSRWLQELRQDIESLVGETVTQWRGVEMALAESDDPHAIVWRHPSVPFLQCDSLDILAGSRWRRFGSTMVTSGWGIALRDDCGRDMADAVATFPNPIFRRRDFRCLPAGMIHRVECRTDSDGLISSVTIAIETSIIEIRCGEVYDDGDGSFRIVEPDEESLLVQVDGRHPECG